MSNTEQTIPTPSRRAMEAAVVMEVHAMCSTKTIAKAEVIDGFFPGHDGIRAAALKVLNYAMLDEILDAVC